MAGGMGRASCGAGALRRSRLAVLWTLSGYPWHRGRRAVDQMACAAVGFILAAAYLYRGITWSERAQQATWRTLAVLAATALTAAAFLRWFSWRSRFDLDILISKNYDLIRYVGATLLAAARF